MIPAGAIFKSMISEHLAQLGTPNVYDWSQKSNCQDFNSVLEMQTSVESIIVCHLASQMGGDSDKRSL